ncbi:NitT/TauT family transport system substrate-binding protein [Inquilinus ginsengisoli]|uniref:NitT/TauT family transport system substrate-binding protein n=1 Tax=Inquilinus ginsengisoli TaxID=363840 RepID=A0ABU1JTF9_9PROT|nr:ABC transporter substrate-binding protein [Inquilinus ginsengisoli]MDR6291903.1 NitT/TauT family transport system substrate-binding protein [Inquilinus ginsengisoli]
MQLFGRVLGLALGLMAGLAATSAFALDKVTFGTNWLAQAEHGGYYQAVADGTYAKFGLEVTIAMGGPQAANRARLVAGQIDFYMGGTLDAFDAVKEGVPTVNVAAIFQKDPQVLLAHPERGFEKLEDMAKVKTLFLAGEGYDSFFRWLKSAYPGFTDEQYKPYTFNPGPFIADPNSAQQGYLTSEPLDIEKQAGWKPKVFLLADYGYTPYSTTIAVQQSLVDKNPDLVQRFVDATIIGWYNYLYGDNAAANALIRRDNPEMTDEQIAYGIAQLKANHIVIAGEAEAQGIGCMTAARYQGFYDKMVKAGVLEAGLDVGKAFTTQFVCKGVGLDVYKKLAGG